jgi:Mrp family chromosome partitioning ATPase
VGQYLGLPGYHAGIDDYLSGNADLQDTGIKIHDTDLTVHRVRNPNPNPENMLSSSKLLELADTIRHSANEPICIIDTPPAVIHDDIMLIAPAVESIIMVVQEGRTSRRALTRTIKSLSPTPVIGTVLNMSISSPPLTSEYGDYLLLDTVHQSA